MNSQQNVDRVKGTVQSMLEVELEETEMWPDVCELEIERYVSSYNPKYRAEALSSLISHPRLTRKTKEMMRVWCYGGCDWEPESAMFLPPSGLSVFHPGYYSAGRVAAFGFRPSAALPAGDWCQPQKFTARGDLAALSRGAPTLLVAGPAEVGGAMELR